MSDDSTAESSQDSFWADCADCGSRDTDIAPLGDENPIICNDCGARSEGINKVGGGDD